jgi:uncharacterized protein (TIGR02453 family)
MSQREAFPGFPRAMVEFLIELHDNNDRDWFKANQARYEQHVREPTRAFVRAMAPRLAKISKRFVASDKKVGGSMMRPQRDTRFSPDKTPYKTNVGIQFRHEAGKDVHAPGFYLHIDPAEVFIGVGMWHPDAPSLAAVRARIVDKPAAFERALAAPAFKKHFELSGDSLKRPPRGFDPEHPLVEHLRRKDHIAVATLDHAQLMSPKAAQLVADRFAAARPYAKFQCDALELGF